MAMDLRASERDRAALARSANGHSNLGRSAAWGVAAVAGLAAVITLAQTPSGNLRLQSAMATMAAIGVPDAPHQAATSSVAPASASDAGIKVLQTQLERLTAERDRIEARLTTLEHGFEDVTGSIRQVQAATVTAQPGVPSGPREPSKKTAREESDVPDVPLIDPLSIPPAGSVPNLPKTAIVQQPAVAPITATEAAPTAAVPAVAAPPPPAVPVPPQRATVAVNSPPAAPARHEYGIALATAPDLDGLRARWTAAKANFGPLLVGLNPLAMRDSRGGGLRLVAGPLPTFAAARDLCTRFAALHGSCVPARVDPAAVVQR